MELGPWLGSNGNPDRHPLERWLVGNALGLVGNALDCAEMVPISREVAEAERLAHQENNPGAASHTRLSLADLSICPSSRAGGATDYAS
jgi:hypothetical protein